MSILLYIYVIDFNKGMGAKSVWSSLRNLSCVKKKHRFWFPCLLLIHAVTTFIQSNKQNLRMTKRDVVFYSIYQLLTLSRKIIDWIEIHAPPPKYSEILNESIMRKRNRN